MNAWAMNKLGYELDDQALNDNAEYWSGVHLFMLLYVGRY